MSYNVVVNQRQPQYTYNVLQRRCQPRPTIICIFYGGGRGGGGIRTVTLVGHASAVRLISYTKGVGRIRLFSFSKYGSAGQGWETGLAIQKRTEQKPQYHRAQAFP